MILGSLFSSIFDFDMLSLGDLGIPMYKKRFDQDHPIHPNIFIALACEFTHNDHKGRLHSLVIPWLCCAYLLDRVGADPPCCDVTQTNHIAPEEWLPLLRWASTAFVAEADTLPRSGPEFPRVAKAMLGLLRLDDKFKKDEPAQSITTYSGQSTL